MSLVWGRSSGAPSVAMLFIVGVLSGCAFYGLYWIATLALRALGVTLTGVPQ